MATINVRRPPPVDSTLFLLLFLLLLPLAEGGDPNSLDNVLYARPAAHN